VRRAQRIARNNIRVKRSKSIWLSIPTSGITIVFANKGGSKGFSDETRSALCALRSLIIFFFAVRGKCAGHFSGFQRFAGIQLQFSFFEDNGCFRNDH
jgi:hypothetical protein